MASVFQTIGLIGRLRCEETANTIDKIIQHLQKQVADIVIDEETASVFPKMASVRCLPRATLAQSCDLVIVVGGDGSLLSAARAVLPYNTPLLGVNRGHLGFLTDVHPQHFASTLDAVLSGAYASENRFLLQTQLIDSNQKVLSCDPALNDVVLSPGEVAQLIDFDIFVNGQLMCHNRSDGLIIATPTGSTAYALSAGGPILHPQLDAMVLVPMFPHTLSSRPIVISGNSHIKIVINKRYEAGSNLSIDGQRRVAVPNHSYITIEKHPQLLHLIHPNTYQYFDTLRQKLGWENKLGQSHR